MIFVKEKKKKPLFLTLKTNLFSWSSSWRLFIVSSISSWSLFFMLVYQLKREEETRVESVAPKIYQKKRRRKEILDEKRESSLRSCPGKFLSSLTTRNACKHACLTDQYHDDHDQKKSSHRRQKERETGIIRPKMRRRDSPFLFKSWVFFVKEYFFSKKWWCRRRNVVLKIKSRLLCCLDLRILLHWQKNKNKRHEDFTHEFIWNPSIFEETWEEEVCGQTNIRTRRSLWTLLPWLAAAASRDTPTFSWRRTLLPKRRLTQQSFQSKSRVSSKRRTLNSSIVFSWNRLKESSFSRRSTSLEVRHFVVRVLLEFFESWEDLNILKITSNSHCNWIVNQFSRNITNDNNACSTRSVILLHVIINDSWIIFIIIIIKWIKGSSSFISGEQVCRRARATSTTNDSQEHERSCQDNSRYTERSRSSRTSVCVITESVREHNGIIVITLRLISWWLESDFVNGIRSIPFPQSNGSLQFCRWWISSWMFCP